MRKEIILLLLASLFCASTKTNAQPIHSISTCPGQDCSGEMNISWGADTAVNSWVLWRKAGKRACEKPMVAYPIMYRTNIYNGKLSKSADNRNITEEVVFNKCRVKLKNLEPDTIYKYQICTSEGGEMTVSDTYSFKTAGAKEWSACIISDFHNYSPIPGRLAAAEGMIGIIHDYDPSFDWVLHLGDICAWGGSYSFWMNLYRMPWFTNYMWAGVNGNHDNMSRKYELTNEYFRNSSAYPLNGYPGELGVCYWFKYGEALFIMLNSESMRSEEGLAAAQEWFKRVVSANRSKYIIVCEHYQWFFGTDGEVSQFARWSKLFDEYGVDLALAGNNHIYVRTNALYNGKETDGTQGTVYVQTPSCDNERGQDMNDSLTYNADIIRCRWTEGPKTVGAMSIKVNHSQIELALLNRNGQVIDKVTVKAKR